jgi:hypothetical protein
MGRILGYTRPAPKDADPQKGVTLHVCLGAHFAGCFVATHERQLQVCLGWVSVELIGLDVPIYINQLIARHKEDHAAIKVLLARLERLEPAPQGGLH